MERQRKSPLEPDPVIELYKKDIDRSLIRQNLRRTVRERLENLLRLGQFREEIERAGRAARATGEGAPSLRPISARRSARPSLPMGS
jgi:hypothetical protein